MIFPDKIYIVVNYLVWWQQETIATSVSQLYSETSCPVVVGCICVIGVKPVRSRKDL